MANNSYTMGTSGCPRAEGVHIRQTTNAHGITVMCRTAPPLMRWKQLKPGSMRACKPIVFIGKVVGIDCGVLLTRNFQCIVFIDTL